MIEGPATLLLLIPVPRIQWYGALFQLILQVMILLTGNYTYFNLLTILLCLTVVKLPLQKHTYPNVCAFCVAVWMFGNAIMMFDLNSYTHELSLAFTTKSVPTTLQWTIPAVIVFIFAVVISSSCLQMKTVVVRVHPSKRWKILRISFLICTLLISLFILALSSFTLTTLDAHVMETYVPPVVKSMYVKTQAWAVAHPYGLFRSMTGVGKNNTVARPEIIIEGSEDGKLWKEFHFKYKPGDFQIAPTFIAPHQPRLDWQLWFAALGSYQSSPWFIRLVNQLLEGSVPVKQLLDTHRDPFPVEPPQVYFILK